MRFVRGIIRPALLASPAILIGGALHAQVRDFGQMANSLSAQGSSVTLLISTIAFVLGVVMAMTGILKFRQNAQNPNDPSSRPLVAFSFIFAGSAMIALPALLMTGVVTIFGTGAALTGSESGFNVIPF